MALTIEELVGKLGLEIDEGAFETGRKIMESIEHGLIGIGSALVAYAGGMQILMHSTRAQAEDARVASQELGLTTDAVQELDFAAEASGVSIEAMRSGLGHLARSLFEAQHGSQQAMQAFYILGGVGKHGIHDLDSALTALAEKFSKLPEGPKKVALAMELLGRGGRAMLPILNRGAEGLAELREEAHLTGYVIDKETIAQAHEWELADHRLKASLIGLRNEIAGPLIKGAGNLALKVAEFIRANRPMIAGIIRKPYELLRGAIEWLTKNTWLLRVAFVALTGVLATALLPALIENATWMIALGVQAAVAAAKAAVAWAATVLPVVAVAAAFAVAYLVIQDVYTYIKGGDSVLGRAIQKWETLRKIVEGFKAIGFAYEAVKAFAGGKSKAQFENEYFGPGVQLTPEAKKLLAEERAKGNPLFSPETEPTLSPRSLAAQASTQQNSQQINLGGITVHATTPIGGSPQEYGAAIAEQVRPVVREEINRCNQEALMSIPPTADTSQP